ncbi:MAG: TadE/TadG family type IV pilus assembly protein [Pseudooceanicola sp.]
MCKALKSRLKAFSRESSGSATIETVIWIPIFVWVLALIVNVSMIVFDKNQAYRIIQNANRILSTGFMQTEEEVEAYIVAKLADIAPDATVETIIAGGVVTSRVQYQVSDLLLPHAVTNLANVWINISSQHYVEF